MSTKIYNAYLWNDSIENLLSYLKEYKKEYIDKISDFLYSHTKYLENEVEKTDYKDVYFYLSDEQNKSKSYDNIFSFVGSIIIYPHNNKIAVQFYTERFIKIKLDDRLTDYHYQNQVDSDNTEEEDEERKEFWKDYDIPVEDGFCYELITNYSLRLIVEKYNNIKKQLV
jgi:hypothetical protein